MDWHYLFLDFDGRIGRRDWWTGAIILFLASIIGGWLFGDGFIGWVISVLMLIPTLGVHIKRFHDRGKSGWWVLIVFVPVIGFIWMIVDLGILEGDPGPNRFGPPPAPVVS
ncbi:DUF805 domain-containing protein [Propylenella binzhouense]|uniref:DUF805 domain-containing protein n=1 Tax=Propylenella binzhouense TaxID=2555902 RepID=UPI001FEC52EF|nr:DUF805 domain-containing protein [Propylenella binzhouense]